MADEWMAVMAIEELEEVDLRGNRLNKRCASQLVDNLEEFISAPSRRSELSVGTKVVTITYTCRSNTTAWKQQLITDYVPFEEGKRLQPVILLQVCDDNARILIVNVRYPGRIHGAFIFANSSVREGLQAISFRDNFQSVWLLADSEFPLQPWLMTPFEGDFPPDSPEDRYNRRHASTRNVIERCNGILKSRWRRLLKHRVLHYMPDKASEIIKSCCVHCNMCINNNIPLPDDADVPDDELGMDVLNIGHRENMNRVLPAGRRIRNQIVRNYFTNV
ncbi:hypothetical protein PR048_020092 [Dryococelus australis]|uniref:DDE Tnp4 domain-containing protein n=1 Tax=Dryococelus australis TaxID=614101 RepID=A0ABQ9H5B4_9NEOP|nr:hypothetical protein PR048_020092 [Dryococelus australis]